jgi:hypothetical protein
MEIRPNCREQNSFVLRPLTDGFARLPPQEPPAPRRCLTGVSADPWIPLRVRFFEGKTMVPDRVDLDHLRSAAAVYRRHARAIGGSHRARLLVAARYEARVRAPETRHGIGQHQQAPVHGRS